MDVTGFLQTIAAVLAIGLAAGTLYSIALIAKHKGQLDAVVSQVDLMAATNGELRDSLTFERNERKREREENATQVAELRGEVNVLKGDLVQGLVQSVAAVMADTFAKATRDFAGHMTSAVTDAIHHALNDVDRRRTVERLSEDRRSDRDSNKETTE